MDVLETIAPTSLVVPWAVWILVAVGWTAASMGMTSRKPGGGRAVQAWQRLLVLFGPLFLLATLQLGRRVIAPAATGLLALVAMVAWRRGDLATLTRQLAGGNHDAVSLLREVRRIAVAWWQSSAEPSPGSQSAVLLLKKDGSPYGGRDFGVDGSAAYAMIQEMLGKAVAVGATDVHLEPKTGGEVHVRYRIDGMLQPVKRLPAGLGQAVVSVVKVVGDMDIAERRRPQDGSFAVLAEGRRLEMRAATAPTNYGEKAALRLLETEGGIIRDGLDALGMTPGMVAAIRGIIHRSQGMLIVCGPTGSGKTTSVYAALGELDALVRNIVTIEDPIEYRLENVSQTAVNPAAELTFATILRSVLRQDPDVILVGEVRDRETAEVAMQAALTGHLVFTTLHANDTLTTLTRLMDIGIDATLIQSTVTGILAQRLVRVLCPDCKEAYEPQPEFLRANGIRPGKVKVLYKEVGCGRCLQTGFRGRTGVYEFLPMDGALRKLLVGRPSIEAIRAAVMKSEFRTLQQQALRKVLEGVTSVSEAKRVTA
jgi:type II secretory ATPase GspE/PulE/Tfp pilus assembly ATPase PilB-like protein